MSQKQHIFKWPTYSSHIGSLLQNLLKSNELKDVTLVCDDKRVLKAHKVVLSACSSVFKSIIDENPQTESVVYLGGIKHKEMESILEFMYTGVATLAKERLNEFLDVAKTFNITEITNNTNFPGGKRSNKMKKVPDKSIGDMKYNIKNKKSNYKKAEIQKKAMNELQYEMKDYEKKPEIAEKSINELKYDIKDNRSNEKQETKKEYIKLQQQYDIKTEISKDKLEPTSDTHNNELQYDIKPQNYLDTVIKVEETGPYFDSLLQKWKNRNRKHRKHPCNKCDSKFTTKSHLKTHVSAIHEGVKYTCNQCYKKFPQTGHLRRHIQSVHEGVKYECNLCDEQFTLQNSLRSHIYSVHVGEKYDCTQCKEQFSKKFNLTRHYKRCKATKKVDFNKVVPK